jgi:putative flavoprotein involved in K+ transport
VAKNALIRKGMLLGFEAENARFENDDDVSDIKNIVWATGFKNDYSWINLPVLDAEGAPLQKRGKVAMQAGLYFMGIKFMYRADSSNLGGVWRDAKWIAADLRRFLGK